MSEKEIGRYYWPRFFNENGIRFSPPEFFKLAETIKYHMGYPDSKMEIFSYQYDRLNTGVRKFVSITREALFETLKRNDDRHFYEILLPDNPCKLYFDLEYLTLYNEGKDKNEMVKNFVRHVCSIFSNYYSISIDITDAFILDATTEKKVSFHVLFDLPDGKFVKDAIEIHKVLPILSENKTPENAALSGLLKQMVVNTAGGRKMWFWDETVYGRTQNFRMFDNKKLGQENLLIFWKKCKYFDSKLDFSDGRKVTYSTVFYNSFVKSEKKNLPFQKLITFPGSALPVPIVSQNIRTNPLKRKSTKVDESFEKKSVEDLRKYAKIFEFVEEYVKTKNGDTCCFEKMKINTDGSFLTLIFYKSFYCGNVLRSHRNNHVYYKVDMNNKVFFQQCHAAGCKRSNSEPKRRPIPDHVFQCETSAAICTPKVTKKAPIQLTGKNQTEQLNLDEQKTITNRKEMITMNVLKDKYSTTDFVPPKKVSHNISAPETEGETDEMLMQRIRSTEIDILINKKYGHCVNDESVQISRSPSISDAAMMEIGKAIDEQLENPIISQSISDAEMMEIGKAIDKELENPIISPCPSISDDVLLEIGKIVDQQLEIEEEKFSF